MKRTSKYLSLLLRHNPEDLEMDTNGYVKVNDVLNKCNITFVQLKNIVFENDKQRFSFNEDETLIRANQGHTIKNVELELEKITNPNLTLFHGTCFDSFSKIRVEGLKPMLRNYCHLTDNIETAKNVGLRYAKTLNNLIVFEITTKQLFDNNIEVFVSKNGVYQIKYIPKELLTSIQHFNN